jgi:hypothetical protein
MIRARTATLALAATMVASLFAPVQAEEGKHWKFNVVNKSNNPVVEFRTQEDGEWSENWISDRIEPGDDLELDFETDEGQCVVRTQIRFTDGTFFDADVDYCKANLLEISADTLVWKGPSE